MTRWARGGNGKGKKELDATPWSKLQKAEAASDPERIETEMKQPEKMKPIKIKPRILILDKRETSEPAEAKDINKVLKRKDKPRRRMGLLHSLMPDDYGFANDDKETHGDNSDDERDVGVAGLLEKMHKEKKVPAKSTDTDEIDQIIMKEKRRDNRRLKRIDKRQSEMVIRKMFSPQRK